MSRPKPGDFPTYFEGYIGKVQTDSAEKLHTVYSEQLASFYTNLPDAKADYAYAADKWTLKDLLQHVIDTERIMSYRLLRIARKDETPLASFDENSYAANARASNRSFTALKEEFLAVRKSTDLLLQSLEQEQFENAGTASGNKMTANALAYIIFGHMLHHKTIIEERYL
jgi:uncharacterized damage-inducible protein DinB